tara:strand:+ start:1949 stop:2545 length:597 start_codon:yes stop_codon:yes gene_type:complete
MITDNFLDEKSLKQVENAFDDFHFMWFLRKEQIAGQKDGFYFAHKLFTFLEPLPQVSMFYKQIISPFRQKIKWISLINATCNLLTVRPTPLLSAFHQDWPDHPAVTTSIFYVNTNNGYTEMEDGTKIHSIKNRFAELGYKSHRAVGQTDIGTRIVINLNYIKPTERSIEAQEEMQEILKEEHGLHKLNFATHEDSNVE